MSIKIGISISNNILVVPPGIPTGVVLALIVGGIRITWNDTSGGTAQTEIWYKINSSSYSLLDTMGLGIITKDDVRTRETLMTYKLRTLRTGLYSAFTPEYSIAMLGANLIPSASSDFTTDGTAWWDCTGTKAWNAGTRDMTFNKVGTGALELYKDSVLTIGKTYEARFIAKSSNLNTVGFLLSEAGPGVWTPVINPILQTTYQDYRFIHTQANNSYVDIMPNVSPVTDKEITIDDIKFQEVL